MKIVRDEKMIWGVTRAQRMWAWRKKTRRERRIRFMTDNGPALLATHSLAASRLPHRSPGFGPRSLRELNNATISLKTSSEKHAVISWLAGKPVDSHLHDSNS